MMDDNGIESDTMGRCNQLILCLGVFHDGGYVQFMAIAVCQIWQTDDQPLIILGKYGIHSLFSNKPMSWHGSKAEVPFYDFYVSNTSKSKKMNEKVLRGSSP